jgi:hypothetical protein
VHSKAAAPSFVVKMREADWTSQSITTFFLIHLMLATGPMSLIFDEDAKFKR